MTPKNEKDEFLEEVASKVTEQPTEAKEEPKQKEPVLEEKPKSKPRKRRAKKIYPKASKELENTKNESDIIKKKATGFKKTEIKIMPGRPRSKFKKEEKEEKVSKNNRVTKRSNGIDFEG